MSQCCFLLIVLRLPWLFIWVLCMSVSTRLTNTLLPLKHVQALTFIQFQVKEIGDIFANTHTHTKKKKLCWFHDSSSMCLEIADAHRETGYTSVCSSDLKLDNMVLCGEGLQARILLCGRWRGVFLHPEHLWALFAVWMIVTITKIFRCHNCYPSVTNMPGDTPAI